ncbi:hypothetical protein GGR92_001836 [Spirosoma lacussanchae]|uniref:hypothetical protein n=1 Tax=Spirosoma lacussanchae TaxID=1884249 RepID=UPI001107DFE1|nr:hypothetical protein [Spirosoma lacussanchae]
MSSRSLLSISVAAVAIMVVVLDSAVMSFVENTLPAIFQKYYAPVILGLVVFIATTLRYIGQRLTRIELQEIARTRLNELFDTLKKNEGKIKSNQYLESLQENIIDEARQQIDGIGTITPHHPLTVNNEFQRIQYIRHLFKNNQCKEIIAVTYDINNYFLNFWGGQNYDEFIKVNKFAAKRATIKRYFIVNKVEFEDPRNEKRLLYNQILSGLSNTKKITHKLIYEEDLLRLAPDFPKRSFLLIDNFITSEIKYGSERGYLAFGEQESIVQLKNRHRKLTEIRSASS